MPGWQLRVEVFTRDGALDVLEFTHTPVTIGASPKCDVVLPDPQVSAAHGKITISGGRLTYRDSSSNGSYRDGRRIAREDLGTSGAIDIPPFLLHFTLDLENLVDERTERRYAEQDAVGAGDRAAIEREAGLAPADGALTVLPAEFAAAAAGHVPQVTMAAPAVTIAAGGRPVQPSLPDLDLNTARVNGLAPDASDFLYAPTRLMRPGDAYFRFTLVQAPEEYTGLRIVHASPQSVMVGRNPDCDIVFNCPTVSRRHAAMSLGPAGTWIIEDLHSRNGTRVNGEDLEGPRALTDGDEIEFGTEIMAIFASRPDPADTEWPLETVAPCESEPAGEPADLPITPPAGARTGRYTPTATGARLALRAFPAPRDARVLLVEVHGLVDGDDYNQLKDAMGRAIDGGCRAIVLDLAPCASFDRSCFAALLSTHTRLTAIGGQLRLVGATPRILEDLAFLRLEGLLKISADVDAAVDELKKTI